ncbi:hypothetical protein Poli38472_008994 [Pythium oligandrum]|uniref:Uncharacterized protein n=1 Tax=Pythium oligandrum TaxID=41045 RepID=A0A8K1CM28_PYTOL|nr:hypothetical protein Poli38472_008994 [Pythium oligandrum]|eukprot:TMW64827.1 hypothetical protein Poli38472_008994 [Pythium oligandrum]
MTDPLREAADGFFLAAEHGRSDVIKALADHAEGKIDFSQIVDAKTGRTPLHVAVANRKTDALRVLLTSGFPPEIESRDTNGSAGEQQIKRTAYALAVEMKAHDLLFVFHQFAIQQVAINSVQGVEQLLHAGVPCDMTDGAQMNTLLHWSVTCRAVEVLRFLLDLEDVKTGHIVDQANADGATPLHLACRDGLLEFVRLLLERGADPRCTGTGGFCKDKTPLDVVTSTEIRELLERSQDQAAVGAKQSADVTEGDATEEERAELTKEDEIAMIHKKYALQLEEKDLLIRQLRTTIEALVVEAQEIRKLGEERTVLDYIRKLREERDIVHRQLEDAEDHIRIQQSQIQELKGQIREMVVTGQVRQSKVPSETTAAQKSTQQIGGPRSEGAPRLGRDMSAPRSNRTKASPPVSSNGRLGGVWGALWGNNGAVEGIEADGEVIMTV